MSDVKNLIDRKMEEVLLNVMHMLHDSPLPSNDDILHSLGIITSFVKDIKAEVKHLESMIPNMPNKQEEDSSDDPLKDILPSSGQGETLGDPLTDLLGPLAGEAIDTITGVPGSGQAVLDAWRSAESSNPGLTKSIQDKVFKLQQLHYLRKIWDELNGNFFVPFDSIMDRVRRVKNDMEDVLEFIHLLDARNILDVLDQLQDIGSFKSDVMSRIIDIDVAIDECCSQMSSKVNDLLTDVNENHIFTTSQIDALNKVLIGYGERMEKCCENNNSKFAEILDQLSAILDKIVECCAVEKLQQILETVLSSNDKLDSVLTLLRTGGAPPLLSQLTGLESAIKSMQSDISEIRRLL